MKKLLSFILKNETKGALRYEEVNKETGAISRIEGTYAVGTIYIRKSALPAGKLPQALTVELEWQD